MRGGLQLDPNNPLYQTVQVAVDYIRFKHIDKFVKFHDHVRSLPGEERLLTWVALALAGVAVVATPVLAGFASRFAAVPFQDVQEQAQSLPVPALVLAFLAFSLGWGYCLSGAAQGPALLWILAGLLYEYMILQVGLAAGRSYLHAVPFLLPVALGALTPNGRLWGKLVLIAFVARFAIPLLPFPVAIRAHWYYLWPFAIALLVGVHLFLARRPWPTSLSRAALGAGATLVYVLAIAATVRNAGQLAGSLHVSLNTAIGYLDLLWFLLGASFVGGAIALAVFARKGIERIFPAGTLHWAILGGWIALAAWAFRSVPKGTHGPYDRYVVGILLASLLVLVALWRLKGITKDWLAGWFVASVAAVLSLRTYLSMDIGSLVSGKADVRVLFGFAYAITWEVASHIRSVPLSMPALPQPAPVLLYLGMVLIICGASLFGLAANLKYFQEAIILNEYRGALSLGLPLGLLAAAATWPVLPQGVIRRCVAGFLLASVLAIPAFLLRAAAGPWTWPLLIGGLVAFTLILARLWAEIERPLAGAALGCATGLGFAVSISQRMFIDVLWQLMTMIAAFSGIPGSREPAKVVQRWSADTVWSAPDQVAFFVAAPLLTMLAGALFAAVKRKPRP